MNLDVRTMYMAMGAACFIVAIAIFIFHAGRFRRDGTLAWAIGWVFQGAFWVLVGLRGVIWDFVSIVVAHTFLAASFSILYAAVREFQERTYDRGTLLLPAVATFMFFWYFSVYVDNVFYRVIFISLLSILQIIAIVWALFRDTSVQERRSYRLTGFAFLVMEGIWIIRFLEGFTLPYGHLSALEATTFRNTSVLIALGTVILSSIGFVLMARERAEQTLREGEEQLRQAEEKSRLLIKYAPSMIYEVDYNRAAFKSVNDVMCQFLGYTREELLAMSPFDLLNDEGKAVFRERIRRKLAGEAINDSVEYKSRTKDGREVYGVLNMTFTYKDGKPEGAVGLLTTLPSASKRKPVWQPTLLPSPECTLSAGGFWEGGESSHCYRKLWMRLLPLLGQSGGRCNCSKAIHCGLRRITVINSRFWSSLSPLRIEPPYAARRRGVESAWSSRTLRRVPCLQGHLLRQFCAKPVCERYSPRRWQAARASCWASSRPSGALRTHPMSTIFGGLTCWYGKRPI